MSAVNITLHALTRGMKQTFPCRFYSFFTCILISIQLSGCFYQVPEQVPKAPPPYPKSWTNPHLATPVSGIWLPVEYRAILVQLMEEGIQNNHQLKAQAARVDIAVQNAIIAGADSMPELAAYLRGGRQRSQSSRDSFGVGLDLAWELDILGKLSDRKQAAILDARMSVDNLRASRLTLVAAITGQWFTLLENRQQLVLIQKREQNLSKNLQIIEEGYKIGLTPSLDLHMARADFSATLAKVSAREQEMRKQVRKMEHLLGRYPETELIAAGTLPRKMADIPAGIPAKILSRRPDILAATHALAAANLRVAEAYKNRFPTLRLTGSYGSSTDDLTDLIKGDSLIWSLFAGLTTPLFNGGRLAAVQEKNMARAREAAALYTDTVLSAFVEVEDSLEAEQRLKRQQDQLERASDDSSHAEDLAFEQYQSGLLNYVTVLESERRAFDAKSTALAIYNERMQNRIRLFLALGGDFPATVNEPPLLHIP